MIPTFQITSGEVGFKVQRRKWWLPFVWFNIPHNGKRFTDVEDLDQAARVIHESEPGKVVQVWLYCQWHKFKTKEAGQYV